MTTFILEEHRTRGKVILAQKVLGNESEANTWKPYRVKVIETHDFKSEAAWPISRGKSRRLFTSEIMGTAWVLDGY